MALLDFSHTWIERAWKEMGSSFVTGDVPVAQFELFDVDDLGYPFRSSPIGAWRLSEGKLRADPSSTLVRVPYVAFCIDEQACQMRVQAQWAPRCGFGFIVSFGQEGDVVGQHMCWVS